MSLVPAWFLLSFSLSLATLETCRNEVLLQLCSNIFTDLHQILESDSARPWLSNCN